MFNKFKKRTNSLVDTERSEIQGSDNRFQAVGKFIKSENGEIQSIRRIEMRIPLKCKVKENEVSKFYDRLEDLFNEFTGM